MYQIRSEKFLRKPKKRCLKFVIHLYCIFKFLDKIQIKICF